MTQISISKNAARPLSLPRTEPVVRDWKPLRKGDSLQGFLTLVLPSGMVLYDCTYHQRADGSRWIGMPAQSYKKNPDDPKPQWKPLVGFDSKEAHKKFQTVAVEAVRKYLEDSSL